MAQTPCHLILYYLFLVIISATFILEIKDLSCILDDRPKLSLSKQALAAG